MFYRVLFLCLVAINITGFRISLFSQNSANYIRAGQTYLRNGQYIEALQTLNEAILEFPSSSELYFLRGYAKYTLDDFLGAELDTGF